jgi:hypothetical protein
MSEFKLCSNGHYYDDALAECPFCPKISKNIQAMDLDKTKIDGGDKPLDDKTQIFGGNNSQTNLGKTQIFSGNESGQDMPRFNEQKNSGGRKLTGWLVSFTMDPLGVDFRLYEGRNIVGSDPQCDIVIPNDSSVSSKHLTILYRMGVFKFKDEFSTNGTFVNEVFCEEGNLNDGDIVKIGNTVFKFRTAG